MKKVIYSLAFGLLALSSCTTWDDPQTENYGSGPSIQISLSAGVPTDSAFVITLTPASGTTYYAYAISSSKADVDATTLLKGGYGNAVLNTSTAATFSRTISTAAPNTTYFVYAVASSDKGIVGTLAVDSITTTDQNIPSPVAISPVSDASGSVVTFNEAVTRGTGKITGKYYKEWDIMNPVDIAEEDIVTSIDGSAVTLVANGVPSGAYVCISYEEGAFVDVLNNKCAAITSELNMTTGKFTNISYHEANVAFDITDANVISPEDGAVFPDYSKFQGVLKFDFAIYRMDEYVSTGDLSVTYTGATHTATYQLTADQWSVADSTLTFILPAAPAAGDKVTVSIVEGAVTDVCGNVNNAYTSSLSWKYFAMTKEMVLGSFNFVYQSAYDEEIYNQGVFTVTENPEVEGGLILSNFFLEGSVISGSYDIAKGQMYIGAFETLGIYTNSQGASYGLITYSMSGADNIACTVNADGSITTSDLAIVACDTAYTEILGYFEKCAIAAFTPAQTEASARKAFRKASLGKMVNTKRTALKNRVRK